MRRFGTITAAFIIIVLLCIVEIVVIKSASNYEPMTEIVYAKVKIAENAVISDDMLDIRKVGTNLAHRLSLNKIGDAAGKKTRMDIEAGEMILSSKLYNGSLEPAIVKDKDKKLFSVEFKGDQANGWWLTTDQYVDILFIPDKKEDDTVSVIQRLNNIRIAALIDENGKLLNDKDRSSLPKYISFEVTDEEAGLLAYAKSRGRLEICVIPE